MKHYYLGCPVWANKAWVGEFFSKKARPADFLRQYSSVFNTVEGNSTFYGVPGHETFRRWRRETPENFRFCFKFPQSITHQRMLVDCQSEIKDFFDAIEPVASRVGQLFFQLPPGFNHQWLPMLEKTLPFLSDSYRYGVEVRHLDFYDQAEHEDSLNNLLARHNVNRVLFDTQVLHAISHDDDPDVREAQRKKPRMPARLLATSDQPMLRFVGYKTVEPNIERLKDIAAQVRLWISEGKTPYLFFHSPDDFYAPHLCRAFHRLLQNENTRVGDLPDWPIDQPDPADAQLSLF